MIQHHAFTSVNPRFNREIVVQARLSLPQREISDLQFVDCRSLWDTGATKSMITRDFARNLGLKPINSKPIHHAGGVSWVNQYIVSIALPNNVIIPNVEVGECVDTAGRFDIIIVMNIISLGDFSITGTGDKRMVSFCLPQIAFD